MSRHFALTVRLYDQRYHGADEWPPAPARVFQALVAGVAQGRRVAEDAARALTLLERLAPPTIAAPRARRGQRVSLFVPNNDLDAVGGDPDRVGEVRTKKPVQPFLLESEPLFLYAWPVPEGIGDELLSLAEGLYQLGRGVDPAWAVGELLDDEKLAARLRAHRGTIHRPTAGDVSNELAVPTASSFVSIVRRFDAALIRLRPSADGRSTNFVQPPKAHFAMVRYDGRPTLHLFELRRESEPARSSPCVAWHATSLIERIRDTAVAALSSALPGRTAEIERILIGRKGDGSGAGPIAERVRFIPLPSIGHRHADQAIRRVLVQIPPGPLSEGDVLWALSGRPLLNARTGEVTDTMLAAAEADAMVGRYQSESRVWRSVTPLALGSASRRRIEPKRKREEAKAATERAMEEDGARQALAQALRHAGIEAALLGARVQREPFEAHGCRVEPFAEGTRFAKEALWHVELELDHPVRGPLVLGDGRFLGLGVMAPRGEWAAFALHVEGGLRTDVDPTVIARALRRAIMARAQGVLRVRGENELPSYFHGHASDGEPLKSNRHLAFSVDIPRSRLLVIPPHILDGWADPLHEDETNLKTLELALEDFSELRAGSEGVLSVDVLSLSRADVLLQTAHVFQSIADYVVCRHEKHLAAQEAVVIDVMRECERRKLPRPDKVRVSGVRGVAGVGVVARVEVSFAVSVPGPILLGKTRHLGGGLFQPVVGPRG